MGFISMISSTGTQGQGFARERDDLNALDALFGGSTETLYNRANVFCRSRNETTRYTAFPDISRDFGPREAPTVS